MVTLVFVGVTACMPKRIEGVFGAVVFHFSSMYVGRSFAKQGKTKRAHRAPGRCVLLHAVRTTTCHANQLPAALHATSWMRDRFGENAFSRKMDCKMCQNVLMLLL